MIGMFLFGIYMKVMSYISAVQYGFTVSLADMATVYMLVLIFMIPTFVSLFIGTEYSDGTIRNKLVIGHTRMSIYFSNLITCLAASLLFALSYLAAVFAVGLPLCGISNVDFKELAVLILLSIVTAAATVSISTLAGMLCQSKAATAVTNILVVLFLMVMSIYISARLNEPEYYPAVTVLTDEGEVTAAEPEPNPTYLRGTERQVYTRSRVSFPPARLSQLLREMWRTIPFRQEWQGIRQESQLSQPLSESFYSANEI